MTAPYQVPKATPVPATLGDLAKLDSKFDNKLIGAAKALSDNITGVSDRVAVMEKLRLGERVIEMAGILDGLARRREQEIPVWNWSAMTADEAASAWAELVTWRREMFRVRWPNSFQYIANACWYRHPDVVELLSGLYLSWRLAFTDEDTTPARAADWLDRTRPSLVQRIKEILDNCKSGHTDPLEHVVDHDDEHLGQYIQSHLNYLAQRDAQRQQQPTG